ncbi:hypothetical protein X801_02727 [Opisthorchis viverrini]|uniref:PX domain-containing protein n=1 Tax=Opisthorchis viverrini TaxID=6198 RepID=A0A1S8X3T7_OPIVI|nr:hypothetical protein X801_02727 [Opisthorchis viverrini]
MLSDAQCFGAFKKSSQYVQLLAELDLLKDTSDQADAQSAAESQSVNESTPDGLFGPMQPALSSKSQRKPVRPWKRIRRKLSGPCGNIPKLKLPSKRAFSNMSRDFLNKRRRELDEYLTTLCDSEFLTAYPLARAFVVEFLQPDSWDRSRLQARRVTSLLNPLRTVSNAMKAMPDTLADGFSRMFPGLQGPGPLDRGYRRSASFDTTNVPSFGDLEALKAGGYPMDSSPMDDSPIGKLFLLVDEIFNLHQKNHLSREGNFVILRKIFHPLFGPRVNKMIISKATQLGIQLHMCDIE